VDNLHTFAIEKKALRKKRMFNPNYNVKYICTKNPELPLILARLIIIPLTNTV
jgi:hypothetical protein